jgi:ubiquinone biosynthesis protein UbiJ
MLTALIETASQKIIASDPQTLEKVKRLQGKTIALEIKKINQNIFLSINSNSISIEPQSFGTNKPDNIDVILRAKPSTLLKIVRDGMEDAKLETGELEIEGDAITGQRFASLMNQLDIDWEEIISQKIGDIPARLLFNMFEKTRSWADSTQESMKMNMGEFLVEESRLAAHPEEVDEFINTVDILRNDVARLDARIRLLSKT